MSNTPSPQEVSFEDNHSEKSYNMTAITTSLSSDSFEETSLTEESITKNKSTTKKKKKPLVKKRVLKKKKAPQKKIFSDVPIEIVKGNKVYFHPRNLLSIDPNSTAAKNILKETKKKVRNSDFEILEFTSATRSVDDILELLWEAINGIYIPMSSCNELFISKEHMEDVFQMMIKRAHQPKIPDQSTVVRFNWNQYKEKLSDPSAKSKISNRRKERRRKRERIQQVGDNSTKRRVPSNPSTPIIKTESNSQEQETDTMSIQFEEELNFSNDPFEPTGFLDLPNDDIFFSLFEEEQQMKEESDVKFDINPQSFFGGKHVAPLMLDFAPRFGVVNSPNFLHITGEHLSSASLIPLYYVFPHNSPTSSTPLTGTTMSIENQRMFVSLPSFPEPCSLWIFLQVPFTTTVTTCPNPIYHILSLSEYNLKRTPNNGGKRDGNEGGGGDFNDSTGNNGFGGNNFGSGNFNNGANNFNSFGSGGNNFGFGGNNFGGNNFNNFQPSIWKEGSIWHLACASGNLSIINHLYQKKVPHIDSRDENGKTPLMWAIHNSHLSVVKLLFKLGAKFNLADSEGNTALHLAISKNETAIVEYMLHCGSVDVNILNKENESALDFALALDNLSIIKILLAHPSTLARNSISYWFPDCNNLKKWWYSSKDSSRLALLSNDELVRRTMVTRIDLEQTNSELKKELSQKSINFDEFSKRSQNEIQKLRKALREMNDKTEQISDKLISAKKNNRIISERNDQLSNQVNEFNDILEQKNNEIALLKEALEKKEKQLKVQSELKPKRAKKKLSHMESSKIIPKYSPTKSLKKTQSSRVLNPKSSYIEKSEKLKDLPTDGTNMGLFKYKQIFSIIMEHIQKYTRIEIPPNFNEMNDNDLMNHVAINESPLKTILSEILHAIQDGELKSKLELNNAVKIAVQMRYQNN